MNNDNKPSLRVVNNSKELTEKQRELIELLRSAIAYVEDGEFDSLTLSLVKTDGDILSIASSSEHRHNMVAATVYQLFDLVNSNAKVLK